MYATPKVPLLYEEKISQSFSVNVGIKQIQQTRVYRKKVLLSRKKNINSWTKYNYLECIFIPPGKKQRHRKSICNLKIIIGRLPPLKKCVINEFEDLKKK